MARTNKTRLGFNVGGGGVNCGEDVVFASTSTASNEIAHRFDGKSIKLQGLKYTSHPLVRLLWLVLTVVYCFDYGTSSHTLL
jgi:hypothetical protein